MAKIITTRQRHAAELIVGGMSAYRAMIAAGYSKWTARRFSEFLRQSWGLRQALIDEQERRFPLDRPAPQRKRRYDHRQVAKAAKEYADPRIRDAMSNRDCKKYYDNMRHGEALKKYEIQEPPRRSSSAELKPVSNKCSSCGAHSLGGFMCARCSGGW